MTDEQFLEALETCRLDASEFGHAGHVRAGYLYLRANGFGFALERVRRAVRQFAHHSGQPERYHETVTVAYLALIAQHLCVRGDGGGWVGFARDNPELFQPRLLLHFYSELELNSDLARRVFLLPRADRSTKTECA